MKLRDLGARDEESGVPSVPRRRHTPNKRHPPKGARGMSSGAEPAAAAGGAGEASPLHAAAASGALDAVRRLAKTHDVNARDGEDRTPLKLAAAARHVDVAVLLLSRGAKLGDGDEASARAACCSARAAAALGAARGAPHTPRRARREPPPT